jgi:hypothetical protein
VFRGSAVFRGRAMFHGPAEFHGPPNKIQMRVRLWNRYRLGLGARVNQLLYVRF